MNNYESDWNLYERFRRRIALKLSASALVVKFAFVSACLAIGLTAGCATSPFDPGLTGPFHEIGNYYLVDDQVPDYVRRIAMLPLTSTYDTHTAKGGRETLQPVLYGELSKSRLFEIVQVTEEQLKDWTGKRQWSAEDELPADFIVKIRTKTACDGILFNKLSYYRPYPPIAVGWRLLLVDSNDGQIIWSLDEIFDAGEPRIANSVRQFALANERTNAELTKQVGTRYGSAFNSRVTGLEWINSPRHFARYTASAAIETLTPKE